MLPALIFFSRNSKYLGFGRKTQEFYALGEVVCQISHPSGYPACLLILTLYLHGESLERKPFQRRTSCNTTACNVSIRNDVRRNGVIYIWSMIYIQTGTRFQREIRYFHLQCGTRTTLSNRMTRLKPRASHKK